VLQKACTETDYYNYADAFLTGLQLDSLYEFSKSCTAEVSFFCDDIQFLRNNVTLVDESIQENFFHKFLNGTGLVGGHFSEISLQCYKFGKSVVEKEK